MNNEKRCSRCNKSEAEGVEFYHYDYTSIARCKKCLAIVQMERRRMEGVESVEGFMKHLKGITPLMQAKRITNWRLSGKMNMAELSYVLQIMQEK